MDARHVSGFTTFMSLDSLTINDTSFGGSGGTEFAAFLFDGGVSATERK
jgi:hypothetical protein